MATTLTAENKEYRPQAWERVACPFCGSDDSFVLERFGPQHRYTYVRCKSCRLTYQNPRPRYDQEFVDTAYSVYETSVSEFWDGEKPTKHGRFLFARMHEILSEVEEILGRRGTLLDIGCHAGYFSKVAKDRGWDVTAVDISPVLVDLAQREFGLQAVCGDWTRMEFATRFDAIYCSHVIEHIPNPGDWMRRLRENLKADGLLCIEVPNMNSLDRVLKRLMKRAGLRKDKWALWRTPDHLYEPCARSMVPFMERFGFELVRSYRYSRGRLGRGLLHRLHHGRLLWDSNLRFYLRPS